MAIYNSYGTVYQRVHVNLGFTKDRGGCMAKLFVFCGFEVGN
jgi:hypothetical protein